MPAANHQYPLSNNYFFHPLDFGDLMLIQLGRCYCKADFQNLGEHEDFFELTVVNSGQGTLMTGESEVAVSKGDIHLAGPHELHGIISDAAEPLKYDFFAFRTKNTVHYEQLMNIVRTHSTAAERIFHSENVSSLVANAIWELHNEEYCSKLKSLEEWKHRTQLKMLRVIVISQSVLLILSLVFQMWLR